jgi:hypothetical protein
METCAADGSIRTFRSNYLQFLHASLTYEGKNKILVEQIRKTLMRSDLQYRYAKSEITFPFFKFPP